MHRPLVAVVNGINLLFPPGHQALLQNVQQTFCQGSVYPVIDAIVGGQESRARGVVDLVQACLDGIDSSEIQADTAGSNPSTAFELALGNLLVCNKIANSILEVGGSELCNVISLLIGVDNDCHNDAPLCLLQGLSRRL